MSWITRIPVSVALFVLLISYYVASGQLFVGF